MLNRIRCVGFVIVLLILPVLSACVTASGIESDEIEHADRLWPNLPRGGE